MEETIIGELNDMLEIGIKNRRLKEILGLIWKNCGISRHEIAKELGISKVSITQNAEKLLKAGMIIEQRTVPVSRGRCPINLKLRNDLFYSIGICLYHGYSGIALINAQSEAIAQINLKNLPKEKMGKTDILTSEIKKLLKGNNIPLSKLAGIGIALSGILDTDKGIVYSSSQFKISKEFNLATIFEKSFGVRCFIINTAHLMPLLERRWGSAKEKKTFIYIDSGYGLGMFLDGRLYRGYQGRGGEMGSMQIQESGEPGPDGRGGTLGTLFPSYKITDKLENVIANGGKTFVSRYMDKNDRRVTSEMMAHAIADGDQLCAQLMSELFTGLAKAVVNVAYIFNPQTIYFEPWTAKCPQVTIDIIKRMMGHYGARHWQLETEIRSAICGRKDLARGAALLPVEMIIEK